MRSTFAITRRELEAYLRSPLAYVVSATMLAIFGYSFYLTLYYTREATLRPLFSGNALAILIFVVPLLTMRLLAEEQRSGTLELLLTSPVQDWEVVTGKYLAGLSVSVLSLAPTIYYPIILEVYGSPDWGRVVALYLGLLLLGAAMVSLGTFASSLSSSQIAAAVAGVVLILVLWEIPSAGDLVGQPLRRVFQYLGLTTHFVDFAKGVIDTRSLVYYASVTVGGLYLATRTLETRRRL